MGKVLRSDATAGYYEATAMQPNVSAKCCFAKCCFAKFRMGDVGLGFGRVQLCRVSNAVARLCVAESRNGLV